MTVERRSFSGTAGPTTLVSGIDDNDVTMTVADATGYPTGSAGPFVVTLERGTADEEKILVASRTGDVLSVDTRGYDGTTAVAHSSAATVEHTISAVDLDEANAAAAALDGDWQAFDPGFTITGGSVTARYKQIGKTVHVAVYMVGGSSNYTMSTMDLPVVAANLAIAGEMFTLVIGVLRCAFYATDTSTITFNDASIDDNGTVYASGGLAWVNFTYEAAA